MRELYTYEFKNFKIDNNAIDGVEFARSIVKYAQNNQKRKLLRRVNAIEKTIEDIKISESEYVDFHFELQVNMKKLKSTLKSKGVLTRQEIKEVLNERDVKVTDGQVDVLFRLLDSDGTYASIFRLWLRVKARSAGRYLSARPLLDSEVRRGLDALTGQIAMEAPAGEGAEDPIDHNGVMMAYNNLKSIINLIILVILCR